MKNTTKYILFLLFVLVLGSGQIIKFSHQIGEEDIIPRESVLYSEKEDDYSQTSFNDTSTIPTQFSITVKSRTLPFRISPLSKYLFKEDLHEDINLHARTKSILHRQLFVSAEKRECGYYIYTLRKIVI